MKILRIINAVIWITTAIAVAIGCYVSWTITDAMQVLGLVVESSLYLAIGRAIDIQIAEL